MNGNIYLETAPGGPVVECSPGVWEVVGSIPGRVISKTLKLVLDAFLPSTWHLKGDTKIRIFIANSLLTCIHVFSEDDSEYIPTIDFEWFIKKKLSVYYFFNYKL